MRRNPCKRAILTGSSFVVSFHLGLGARAEPNFEASFEAYGAGRTPFAVAAVDINADGFPEVIVSNQTARQLTVLSRTSGGSLTLSREVRGWGAEHDFIDVHDLNEDGLPDVLVFCPYQYINVFLSGEGTLHQSFYLVPNYPGRGGVVGDFDGDGHLDALGVGGGDVSLFLARGRGDGTFMDAVRMEVAASATQAVAGDLDRDGKLDLVLAASGGGFTLLGNGDGSFQAPRRLQQAITGPPLALADLNSDGILDLVSRATTVSLGIGDGTFAASTTYGGSGTRAQRIADVNGDGHLDIVFADGGSAFTMFLGQGDGTFTVPLYRFEAGRSTVDLWVADIDRDGMQDIVSLSPSLGTVAVHRNRGAKLFGPTPSHWIGPNPQSLRVVDLDADGILDLLATNPGSSVLRARFGEGGGAFAPAAIVVTESRAHGVAVGDLTGDGLPDLATVDPTANVLATYRARPGAVFERVADYRADTGPVRAELFDLDRDGFLDIVWVETSRGREPYVVGTRRGVGDGTFGDPSWYETGADPSDAALADVTGDGVPDLVVACGGEPVVSVLSGHGDGTFAVARSFTTVKPSVAVSVCDVDMDGWVDIILAHDTSPGGSIMKNMSGNAFTLLQILPLPGSTLDVESGDLDADGIPDLAFTLLSGGPAVGVLPGRADGGYSLPIRFHVRSGRDVVAADVTGDGLPDLVVTGTDDSVHVLASRAQRTPVLVMDLTAKIVGDRVVLVWRLAAEAIGAIAGLHVERSATSLGPWSAVTPSPVPPEASMSFVGDLDPTALWYRLVLELHSRVRTVTRPIMVFPTRPESRTVLQAPYERPDGSAVEISYSLPESSPVRLEVFDVRGRRLWDWTRPASEAGVHRAMWNRHDNAGARVRRGVYIVRLDTGSRPLTRKVVLRRP